MTTVMVTGAAGFIGSHLAERLLEAGFEVIGVDCFSDYYDPALKEATAASLPIEWRRTDLAEDPIDLDGVDGVYHLAGQPGVRSFGEAFPRYLRDNLLATQRLLEAAATAGVRVVLASSSSIYGTAERYPTAEDTTPHPISPYGITKLGCEHLARAYARDTSLDVVTVRYFTVYGPRQRPDMAFARVLEALATGRPFQLYGDGSQTRSFTFVGDAVEATLRVMEGGRAGEVFNVGGGSEVSMAEAVRVCERVAGRRLDLRVVERQRGDVDRTAPDLDRIRDRLGWSPQVGLETGLRAQWEWVAGRVGVR